MPSTITNTKSYEMELDIYSMAKQLLRFACLGKLWM